MVLNVVGVGEVLWDLLSAGKQLGGAPCNFAYHAHALGARTSVITRIGSDDLGREIIQRFREMGLSDKTVQVDASAPTGTATVKLSVDGLAHFTIPEDAAWDHLAPTPEALAAAATADAICFGSLAQRSENSRRTIQQLVRATPRNALRVFDINLRQPFYSRETIEKSLKLANVLKLNDDELPTLAALLNLPESGVADGIEHQIERLAEMFSLQVVALTRGANGSLLYQHHFSADGTGSGTRWTDCATSSSPVKVIDTVGAGDSFTAAMVVGMLRNMDLDEINEIANEIARYVCSHPGATPQMPPEFAERFSAAK